jgi:hypothetical protein
MARETDPASPATNEPQPYLAEKARCGEIILRTPWRRTIFIAGLADALLLAILLSVFAWH